MALTLSDSSERQTLYTLLLGKCLKPCRAQSAPYRFCGSMPIPP